jgi:hypothetical protein
MKKKLFIGITTLVILSAVLFADSLNARANTSPKGDNVFAAQGGTAMFFALQAAVKPEALPEEETSLLPYIVSAILIFALVFEIVIYKRKRDKEQKEQEQAKGKSANGNADSSDFGIKAKPKRYGKEQMSEILKASASTSRKSSSAAVAETHEEETRAQSAEKLLEQRQPEMSKLIFELKKPSPIEELPEVVDDDAYFDALVDSEDEEAMMRAVAARILARHKTVNSVKRLSQMTMDDVDPEVRLEGVEGLKTIGHISVFAPLLIAVSDDFPNVKQAAIQAFTSLSLNMADNYARLIESGDEELMKKVARACLVTGLVHKAFVQLSGNNQEQAYEGYALLSLLAKSGETKPLLDAITKHPNMSVRIVAIKIMNEAQKPEAKEQLAELAHVDNLPSFVRTSLMQAVNQNASVN